MKRIMLLLALLLVLGGCRQSFTPIGDQHVIIVVNMKEGSLSFLHASSHKAVATWELEKAVMGTFLLPDGDTLGVYGKELEAIYLYSLRTGEEAGTWEIGKGVVNAMVAENRVLLANQETNAVHVVSVDGIEAARIGVGQSPLTMAEDEEHLYVLDFRDTMVTVVDKKTWKTLRTWRIPESSAGAVVTKQGDMWVGGHGEGSVLNEEVNIYRVQTGELVRTVQASQMPVGFAADGRFVYVVSHGTGVLSKMDAIGYEEKAAMEIGSNPFTVQEYDGRLYVASYDSNEVYIVDSDKMKVLDVVEVGMGPFQMTERKGLK